MARSLIVLPDDSVKPILTAIAGAARTLRVKMFVFSDPSLLKAVVAAKRRGVKVRVMLNPARRSGEHDNDRTRKALERAGIDVKDANPAFALTHEKSMVVDDETAFVKSLNWATKNLTETRDYAVVTTRRHDVAESGGVLRGRLAPPAFRAPPRKPPGLVPRTRAGPDLPVHRRDAAPAVRPERALPGHGDPRAPGASGPARREGARHGAPAAHAEAGEARRRGRRAADHGRRRDQDPQTQAPETARQDAARRRRRARWWARSTWRRAASTDGASWRSRSATTRSSIGCTRSPGTTGSIRTRSISRTGDCWRISRAGSRTVRSCFPWIPGGRHRLSGPLGRGKQAPPGNAVY